MSINPISTPITPLPAAAPSPSATPAADSGVVTSSLLSTPSPTAATPLPAVDPLSLLLSLFSTASAPASPVSPSTTASPNLDTLSLLMSLMLLSGGNLSGSGAADGSQASSASPFDGNSLDFLTLLLSLSAFNPASASGLPGDPNAALGGDFFSQFLALLGLGGSDAFDPNAGLPTSPALPDYFPPVPTPAPAPDTSLADIIPLLSQAVELAKDQLIDSNKPKPDSADDQDIYEDNPDCSPTPAPTPYYPPTYSKPKFEKVYKEPAPYYAPPPAPYYAPPPAPYYAPPVTPYKTRYVDRALTPDPQWLINDDLKEQKKFDDWQKAQEADFAAFRKSVNPNSPLVFDLNNNHKLTASGTQRFDIDNDGQMDKISKLDRGDGLLAFDNDGDGIVGKNGGEVFGNNTDLNHDGKADGFTNGFEALKGFAEKVLGKKAIADGKLDKGELQALEKKGLRLVINGKAQTLSSQGISEIQLGYSQDLKKHDTFGNGLYQQSSFKLNGKSQNVTDVWFVKKK